MDTPQTGRMTLIAVSCIVLFFLTNYLLRYLVGMSGLLASLILAVAIAVYMGWSVARSLGRQPVQSERARVLWLYGGFLGALYLAFAGYVFLSSGVDAVALATLFLHYLPYPALAHVFLSDRLQQVFMKSDEPPR
ncbi:hypothetical protein [Marinobacter sp.]|uniref:hypothetical protein n=1 Tax=Marinobacter sp. TaxID=50741 RepID=UPI0034A1B559